MDSRDAFAAKVGNYSLLAAFILQRLGQLRRELADGRPPSTGSELDRNRFDLLHDMFAEAWWAIARVWTIASPAEGADVAPPLENRLAAPAASIAEGLETYDLIASLVREGDDPTRLKEWIQHALKVIETLRNDGIATVLADEKDRRFLDEELQPFLARLKEASRDLVFQTAEGFVFARQ